MSDDESNERSDALARILLRYLARRTNNSHNDNNSSNNDDSDTKSDDNNFSDENTSPNNSNNDNRFTFSFGLRRNNSDKNKTKLKLDLIDINDKKLNENNDVLIKKNELNELIYNNNNNYYNNNILNIMNQRETMLFNGNNNNNTIMNINNNFLSNKINGIEKYNGSYRVFCCDFSDDGNVLCCASQDHVIHLIDSSDGINNNKWPIYKQVESQFSGWSIIDVALSPDHDFVAYSGWSSSIYLVNTYGNHELHTSHDLKINSEHGWGRCCVFGIEFDPNSKKILCSLSGGCLVLHDLEMKQNEFSIINAHNDDINQSTFLNNNIIVSGSDDSLLRVWDIRINNNYNKCVGGFIGHYQGITCVSTPNNNNNNISSNYILSNSKDQSMKLWDLRLMNTKSDLNKTKKELQMWSKTRSFDYRYRAWDSSSNYKNKKFRLDKSLVTYKGHEVTRTLCRSGFSPTFTTNNKYVYCGSSNNKIYIYETNTGKLFKTLHGHNDIVRDVTWHPYQPIIVSAAVMLL